MLLPALVEVQTRFAFPLSCIYLLSQYVLSQLSEGVHHSCAQCLGIAYTDLLGGDLIRWHIGVSYRVGVRSGMKTQPGFQASALLG